MVAELRRFPEFEVTLLIFSGAVSDCEAADLFRSIDERDRRCRISYFSEDVDLAPMVATTPVVKRAIVEKQRVLTGGRHAIVCLSKAAEDYIAFLQRYLATEDFHPAVSKRVFSSLKAACDWLGLSDETYKALAEAAHRVSPEDRRGRDKAGAPLSGPHDHRPH